MNVNEQLMQITDFADELNTSIENESWEMAMQLSHQWDVNIRKFIGGLSAEQCIKMKGQIESLASQNKSINNRLVKLRAKVLTQIQENNNSRKAIKQYNNSV